MQLNVNDYQNYRLFLKDVYAHRKKQSTGFSYATWARLLGIKSPSHLIMIIGGSRHPGKNLTAKIAKQLRLSKLQSEYFSSLVNWSKSNKDLQSSLKLMEQFSDDRKRDFFQTLSLQEFEAISAWYYYAIREMANLPDFQEDPYWIAARLKNSGKKIDVQSIKKALNKMLSMKLLKRNPEGRIVQGIGRIDTSTDIGNEGLKRYHEGILDIAKSAIRSTPVENREISGVTFAMPRNNLKEAKQLITRFQKEFVDLLESEKSGDEIFHLEVAFLPLTQSLTGENIVDKQRNK